MSSKLVSVQGIDILFASHMHEVLGGAEMALLEMLEYLHKKGLRIHVIVGMKAGFTERLTALGIPYTTIGMPCWAHASRDNSPFIYSSSEPTANTTLQIIKLIQQLNPRLCVTNTMVMPWLAYAAAITSIRHAWMIHEMGTAGLQLRYDIGEEQTLRTIDTLSDAIFYNSQITAEYYVPKFTLNKNIRIVYPGGKQPLPSIITSPYRAKALKLVMVGQIKPQKGQIDAVKAVKSLVAAGRDVQLILIGLNEDAGYVHELEQYIKRYGLEKQIIFAGYQKNPSSYVTLADIVLVCSTNEAFGRVTTDAMLLGKPVVGARSGGTTEIISDHQTGLLYNPGDSKDLAQAISTLVDDSKLRLALGKTAKQVATKRYSDQARYKSFLTYFYDTTTPSASINLSPLQSVFLDFSNTIDALYSQQKNLELILSSRSWRLVQLLRKVLLK